jgi:SAM-dependent methyltransferase
MNLYQRLLGTPFVYEHVRPIAVGGIDMTSFFARVDAGADDVVLDVGCGTGDALRYLTRFARYEGFDPDAAAISFARKRYGERPHVSFHCQPCTTDDIARIRPTCVVVCGLLHHLSDDQALTLLSSLEAAPALRRIATSDIVFLKRSAVSNFLAGMDRGKYCRHREHYEALVMQSGLRVAASTVVRSHPKHGLAKYFQMTIER